MDEGKGRAATHVPLFSQTHAPLPAFPLHHQQMRAGWITEECLSCSPWYASLLSNQIQPTCDQTLDETSSQTVYIGQILTFPSVPKLVLNPPTPSLFHEERRRGSKRGGFQLVHEGFGCCAKPPPPTPNPPTPGSLSVTQTFVSFWQVLRWGVASVNAAHMLTRTPRHASVQMERSSVQTRSGFVTDWESWLTRLIRTPDWAPLLLRRIDTFFGQIASLAFLL